MQLAVAAPAMAALLYRAWSRRSLTPLGLVVAFLTATVHALHPWAVFFALLGVFFLAGTAATKVKHDIKAQLTQSSTGNNNGSGGGGSGGEGARTHVQVLANSLVASVLVLGHAYYDAATARQCFAAGASPADLLVVGIIANYAAVAADTLSSELGILARQPPRLLTSWTLRRVPPGTNGGVTATGLWAGAGGAALIAATAVALLPFCPDWSFRDMLWFAAAVTVCGTLGSVLDSLLGGWLQASVVDRRTGKIVEGPGGRSVPYRAAAGVRRGGDGGAEDDASGAHGRYVVAGTEWLDNNGVNLLMAALVSGGSMVVANWWWAVPWR